MRRNEHRSIADWRVERAALCGGTHGNERTGVTVVARRRALAAHQLSPQSEEVRDDVPEEPHPSWDIDPGPLPAPALPHTFTLVPVVTNPKAVAENRRYIDFDLNRSFSSSLLAANEQPGYEAQRALYLNAALGPKGSDTPQYDFIIDLHTTTARLGPTVIIREDDLFARWLAAYIVHDVPEVRVMSYLSEETDDAGDENTGDKNTGEKGTVDAAHGDDNHAADRKTSEAPRNEHADPERSPSVALKRRGMAPTPPAGGAPGAADTPGDYPYLAEITPSGIEVEVGPVPQGVVRAETVIWTERIVNSCISGIDAWNSGRDVDIGETLTVFRYREVLDYPRDEAGNVVGFVHPLRQDRDFAPLQLGDPVFLRFDGTAVLYEGVSGRYPVFINEAAYYEKNAAMTLCDVREVSVW
jgi:succinylglutamate desuccinylase